MYIDANGVQKMPKYNASKNEPLGNDYENEVFSYLMSILQEANGFFSALQHTPGVDKSVLDSVENIWRMADDAIHLSSDN
jgi:hypothetical protein